MYVTKVTFLSLFETHETLFFSGYQWATNVATIELPLGYHWATVEVCTCKDKVSTAGCPERTSLAWRACIARMKPRCKGVCGHKKVRYQSQYIRNNGVLHGCNWKACTSLEIHESLLASHKRRPRMSLKVMYTMPGKARKAQ